MGVAKHTGVGGAAGHVFVHEIVNDIVAKLLADVHDEMVETHVHGYFPGIVDGIEAAAARFFFRAAGGGIIPGFHGDAHHFVALIIQHKSNHGTVNTATHCHQYFSFFAHKVKKIASSKYTKGGQVLEFRKGINSVQSFLRQRKG